MVFNNWADVLNQTFFNLFNGLSVLVPNLVIAIVIFIVGWLIGIGVGRVVRQVVDALRVDQALKQTGVERVLSRAGYQLSSGRFLGTLVEWFFIVLFLVAALDVLQLKTVNTFISTVVLGYLPSVIMAVLILLVSAVLADATHRIVEGSAKAASLRSAGFIGKMSRYAIWIFGILAALDQLGVSPFIQALFQGIIIAASLAFGLAFGLGGQATAARYLERLSSEIKD